MISGNRGKKYIENGKQMEVHSLALGVDSSAMA
jgi:hypothetical protein